MQSPSQSHEPSLGRTKELKWWVILILPLPPLVGVLFILLAVATSAMIPAWYPLGWIIVANVGLSALGVASFLVAFRVSRKSKLVFAVVFLSEVIASLLAWSRAFRHFSTWN